MDARDRARIEARNNAYTPASCCALHLSSHPSSVVPFFVQPTMHSPLKAYGRASLLHCWNSNLSVYEECLFTRLLGCLGHRQRNLRPLFPSLSIFLVGFDARSHFVPSISYLLSLSPRNGTSVPSCTIATVTGERRSFLSRLYRWSFPRGNLVVSTARSFN